MLTSEDARARVAKGAAHLDTVRPGWFNRIDVGTLTLHDPCGCIVGQLCGTNRDEFYSAVQSLFQSGARWEWGVELKTEDSHGSFGVPIAERYQPLQDAWIEAIADRKLAAEKQWVRAVEVMATSEPLSEPVGA